MVTGAAGKHTKIEKTTASRESGFQLSRYLLWNVYAYVYDEAGDVVAKYTNLYSDLDDEWHMYVIDLTGIEGKVSVILNGSYVDDSGAEDSEFAFQRIEVR